MFRGEVFRSCTNANRVSPCAKWDAAYSIQTGDDMSISPFIYPGPGQGGLRPASQGASWGKRRTFPGISNPPGPWGEFGSKRPTLAARQNHKNPSSAKETTGDNCSTANPDLVETPTREAIRSKRDRLDKGDPPTYSGYCIHLPPRQCRKRAGKAHPRCLCVASGNRPTICEREVMCAQLERTNSSRSSGTTSRSGNVHDRDTDSARPRRSC